MKGTESGIQSACLGDVAEFINGVAFKPEDWGEEGSRIIRIQNLTDPSKPYNRTVRRVPERYHVIPGDLLVSWSASLGVFEWVGPDIGLLNQHIFRVIPGPRIDKRYLRYCLEIALGTMSRHLHGATMQHVNRGEFLGTKIPLPPLPEQRRIAAILDQADALRTKRRQALARLDTLTQSIFLKMFGDPANNPRNWPLASIGDLVERIESGWSPSCLDRPADQDEWGVLKLGAVTQCRYVDIEQKALPPELKPRPAIEVRVGDILFTRKNTHDLVAACALVRQTRRRLMFSDLIFRLRLRPDSFVTGDYLHQVLIHPEKRREIQRLASGSAGSMPNISKGRLLGVRIPVPPMNLQRRYSEEVSATERQISAYRASLAQLDSLFASLQDRAFRGEL